MHQNIEEKGNLNVSKKALTKFACFNFFFHYLFYNIRWFRTDHKQHIQKNWYKKAKVRKQDTGLL